MNYCCKVSILVNDVKGFNCVSIYTTYDRVSGGAILMDNQWNYTFQRSLQRQYRNTRSHHQCHTYFNTGKYISIHLFEIVFFINYSDSMPNDFRFLY